MLDFIYGSKNRRKLTLLLVIAAIFAAVLITLFFSRDTSVTVKPDALTSLVTVRGVADIAFKSSFETVGVVQAVSEAKLQAEAGGRITSVSTEIGSSVRAGSVLATIENRAESASLLQAQGAYEAAQAGAAAGNITVDQAKSGFLAAQNDAISAERAAYTSISNSYYTKLDPLLDDQFFTSPSVMLIGSGIPVAKSEGKAFKALLPTWQATSVTLNPSSNLDAALLSAKGNAERMISLVDTLIRVMNDTTTTRLIAGSSVQEQTIMLTTLRSTLNSTLASLESTEVGLRNAREAQVKAALSGTNTGLSTANAQVKIALGSLRAAQASFEKTIVRSPISGVVNALYVKTGEYVSPGQPTAIIANNNGLEISTSVSLENSQLLSVNDTVVINGTASGIITAIAGAIDPTTGKVALKVSVDGGATLENGATVSLAFKQTEQAILTDADITIPLASLKMTGTGPVVFFVTADKTLQAQPVVLGAIRGDSVVITEGLTSLDSIVMDARGLKNGQVVTVVTN